MSSLEDLFCSVDDFCQRFEPQLQPQLLQSGLQTQKRSQQLCLRETMTIVIAFHQQGYRRFIETIIDQLKNISHIKQSWHPSPVNFLVNLVGGLIAYCHQPKKTSIALDSNLLPHAYP